MEFTAAWLLAVPFRLLPFDVSVRVSSYIGDLFYLFAQHRRKVVFKNLDLAYGDSLPVSAKKKIVRECFRNLAVSSTEFLRLPWMTRELHQRFEVQGAENLDLVLARKKGVIFVVSHLGAWEYLFFLGRLKPQILPALAIVRPIKNPFIYQWVQRLRNATGVAAVERKNSIRKILARLHAGHTVAILIDQWAGNDGIWVDFFGKPTSTTPIPARLAEKTGAALIPIFCVRKSAGQYKIIIHPEFVTRGTGENRVQETTLALNRILEKEIIKYPGQWTWFHRRWK